MFGLMRNLKRGVFGFFQNQTEKLIEINPEIKLLKIGQSIRGEDIECCQINEGYLKLIFMSAIHGNEIGTVKLSHHLINWLFENRKKYKKFTFYIIPCLNPDGYCLALRNPDYFGGGRTGRLNAHKVDLNRNFDTLTFKSQASWTHGKDYAKKTQVFAGPHANSEPEIRTLTKFIKDKKPMVILSFHNAGKDVVGNKLELAQHLAKKFSKVSGYRFISVKEWTEFGQTGSSFEWCTINQIPILEIEAGNRWRSDWPRHKEAIEVLLKEIEKSVL